MKNREEYLLKEFEYLKDEIRDYSNELNTLMRYSIAFMGAIYSLIFVNKVENTTINIIEYTKFIIWLPFILNILLFFRFGMIGFFIQEISEHIEKTERNFLEENEGWETHLNHKARNNSFMKLTFMSIPTIVYWLLVIALSFTIAFYIVKIPATGSTPPKVGFSAQPNRCVKV